MLWWVSKATETFTAVSVPQLQSKVVSLKRFLLQRLEVDAASAFPSPARGDRLVCFGPGEAYLNHLWEQGGQGLLIKYLAVWETFDGFECSVRPPAIIYTLYPN